MTTAEQEFTNLGRQGHDAFLAGVQSWTSATQRLVSSVPALTAQAPSPAQFAAAWFDYAEQALGAQREIVSTFLQDTTPAVQQALDAVSQSATKAADSVLDAVIRATDHIVEVAQANAASAKEVTRAARSAVNGATDAAAATGDAN